MKDNEEFDLIRSTIIRNTSMVGKSRFYSHNPSTDSFTAKIFQLTADIHPENIFSIFHFPSPFFSGCIIATVFIFSDCGTLYSI